MREISRNASIACCATAACDAPVIRRCGDFVRGGGVRCAGRYVGQVDANGNPVLVTYSDGVTEQAQVYESDVKTMIALLQPVMEQYIVTSRRFAVRMALQGGLSEYAAGAIRYDAARDFYTPTTERQLAPLFEKIFRDAPDLRKTGKKLLLTSLDSRIIESFGKLSGAGARGHAGEKLRAIQAVKKRENHTAMSACRTAQNAARAYAAALAAANDNEQRGAWRGAAFTLEMVA